MQNELNLKKIQYKLRELEMIKHSRLEKYGISFLFKDIMLSKIHLTCKLPFFRGRL